MKKNRINTFIIIILVIIGMIKTSHSQTIDIYNNEVWNTQQNIILPVIIHSNATLTIEADANFDNNAYIDSTPGGRLVLQNCHNKLFNEPFMARYDFYVEIKVLLKI